MGKFRLSIVLLALALWVVCAHGKADDPPALDFAMLSNQAAVSLAADGKVRARDATNSAFRATVAGAQGDELSAYRLGAGLGRKLLRDTTKMPHNPDLLSQTATQAAQGAVMEAVATQNAQKATTYGHLYGEHATIADSYDTWQLLSGRDKRRLGAKLVDPDTLSMMGGLSAQSAVRAATAAGGDAQVATRAGAEAGVISAVGDADSTKHVMAGELPEGPLAPARVWEAALEAPEAEWPHVN